MKLDKLLCVLSMLLLCGGTVSCGQVLLPEAKVTVRVLDENKQPLEGADASVGFEVLSTRSFESKSEGRHGLTGRGRPLHGQQPDDGAGLLRGGKSPGTTTARDQYRFTSKEVGRWLPYNVGFDVVLKKIVNPVPMYARKRDVIEVPALDEAVGYDLIVSDWVAPTARDSTRTSFSRRKSGLWTTKTTTQCKSGLLQRGRRHPGSSHEAERRQCSAAG